MARTMLSLIALANAFALFALLFVLADRGPAAAAAPSLVGILLACICALRLIGSETFAWMPVRIAGVIALALTAATVTAYAVL